MLVSGILQFWRETFTKNKWNGSGIIDPFITHLNGTTPYLKKEKTSSLKRSCEVLNEIS